MTKHGHRRDGKTSRTYSSWHAMRRRCKRPHHPDYPNYGGRGITICDRWAVFENFLADMGERPEGCTIDRIDNNGNYEPSNCRWVGGSEQCNNRRNSNRVTFGGRTQTVVQWARELGVDSEMLRLRILRGWSLERAFRQPMERHRSKTIPTQGAA